MQSLAQMRVLTATAFLILGLGRAEAATSNEMTSRQTIYEVNIDGFIDKNMEAIRNIAWEMDPANLDNVNFPLNKYVYMYLHTGWLQNLSQLKRSGKCTLRYTNKKLNIDLNLGWDDIIFDYRYLLKIFWKERTGDLHGQMTKLNVHIALEFNFKNYHITLKKLDLQENGKIKLSLEGHKLDNIYNLIIKVVTRVGRNLVLKTINEKLKEMIVHRIDEINFELGSMQNGRQFTFVDLVESTSHDDDLKSIYNSISDE